MNGDLDLGIDGLGDYEEIGAGGFATVYAALEVGTRRRVAVKVLAAVDERGRRRFDREQQTMGQTTDHTNIVTLFRSGFTNPGNNPYLVMEFMAGGSLQDRVDNHGPLGWDEAASLIRPVADALGYSHNAGILHKDVKPANILVSATGVVKLTDFGVSAVKEATATSQVGYSLAYTPPETFDSQHDPVTGDVVDPRDERSDLYSLAVTLYVLGVGSSPFDNPTQAGLMNQILTQPVPPSGDVRIDRFLATAMAKDPAGRYQSAAEFIKGLDAALESSSGAEPQGRASDTVVAPGPIDQWPAPNARPAAGSAPSGPASINTDETLRRQQAVARQPSNPDQSAGSGSSTFQAPAPSPYPGSGQAPVPRTGPGTGAGTGAGGFPFQAPAPSSFPNPAHYTSADSPVSPSAQPFANQPYAAPGPASFQAPTPSSFGDPRHPTPPPGHPASSSSDGRGRWPLVAALVAFVVIAASIAGFAIVTSGDADGDGTAADDTGDGTQTENGSADNGTNDDQTGDTTDSPQEDPPANGADASALAGTGGELTLLQWQAPSSANALLAATTKDLLAASLVSEPLARYDPSGNLVPALAAEIPTAANGGFADDLRSITWTLRPDLQWSDGSPVTADDVVFTYEYCRDIGSCTADVFGIDTVVALDELTVTITLIEPTPYPYTYFVGYTQPILQRAQFADCVQQTSAVCDQHNLTPIGTGPFIITELVPDSRAVYDFNPNYRGVDEGKPFFGTVTIEGGGDVESTARSVLETGDADYAWNLQIAPDTLASWEALGNGRLVTAFGSNVEHLNLNQTNPNADPPSEYTADDSGNHPVLYQNPALATALSLAIDRNQLVEVGYGLAGEPTCVLWPVGEQRSTEQDWCLERDVTRANEILDELGYTDRDGDGVRELADGTPLEFDLVTSINGVRQANQEIIQANWSEIGVQANLRSVEPSVFFGIEGTETIWRFQSDVQMFTNGSATPDPVAYLSDWTSDNIPTSANGWAGFNIPRLRSDAFDDAAAELLRTTPEQSTYLALIRELQDLQVESGAIIPLVHRGNVSAFANSITGVGSLNAWDSEYWNIQDWSRN